MVWMLILGHAMLHSMLLILSRFIRHTHGCGHLTVVVAIRQKVGPVAERVRRRPHRQICHVWCCDYSVVRIEANLG